MASTEFATRPHKGAAFLFLLGFALLATGVAFAYAPQYSWQVHTVARKANELGLQNGALVVGGLVLLGLGVVARTASSSAPAHDSGSTEELRAELNLFQEQVSNKLGQLRASLLQLGEGVAGVAAQQQQSQRSQGPSAGGDPAQDAVFRLAASLDKLHAHFDERVHAVDLQLRSGFESLLAASHELRRLLDQRAQFSHSLPVEPAQAPHGQAGQEGGIDFYETMQKLDAIAGPEAGSDPHGHHPQAPFPSQGPAFDALLPEEYRDRY